MPLAPAAFQWVVAFASGIGTLALDVPGPIRWSTPPVGRVAVHPCTGARTLITRGTAAPPPDIKGTLRVDYRDDQAEIRDALKAAWASGATGLLTPPMTGIDGPRTIALDPSQAFEERQEGAVLFIDVTFLGLP